MRSKRERQRRLITALSGLCLLPLAWSEADARPATGAAARMEADWKRKCTRRAEQNGMRQKLRQPFVKQCIAGYRINANTDLQSKKEKF